MKENALVSAVTHKQIHPPPLKHTTSHQKRSPSAAIQRGPSNNFGNFLLYNDDIALAYSVLYDPSVYCRYPVAEVLDEPFSQLSPLSGVDVKACQST